MVKTKVAFLEDIFESTKNSLSWDGKEKCALLLCRRQEASLNGDKIIKLIPYRVLSPHENDYRSRSVVSYTLKKDWVSESVNKAVKKDSDIIWLHTHPPSSGNVCFSSVDKKWDEIILNDIENQIEGMGVGFIVFDGSFSSMNGIFKDRKLISNIEKLVVYGKKKIEVLSSLNTGLYFEDKRYDRLKRFFGKELKKFHHLDVSIVGVSGLGCIVGEQLARLGSNLTLVDYDTISEDNLNRLIGTSKKDINKKKTEFYSRYFKTINPNSDVISVPLDILTEEAQRIIACSDVILGCLDQEAPRLALNHISQSNVCLYEDLAFGIDENSYGGQIYWIYPGSHICFNCINAFQDGYSYFIDPEAREIMKKRGYIKEKPEILNPSVLSLNMIIGAIAMDILQRYVTGTFNDIFKSKYGLLSRISFDDKLKVGLAYIKKKGCCTCMKEGYLGKGDQSPFLLPLQKVNFPELKTYEEINFLQKWNL